MGLSAIDLRCMFPLGALKTWSDCENLDKKQDDEYYYWSTLIGWSLKIKLQLCKRRKFKHWWSPISSIYTKRTITWTHWTQKRPRHV